MQESLHAEEPLLLHRVPGVPVAVEPAWRQGGAVRGTGHGRQGSHGKCLFQEAWCSRRCLAVVQTEAAGFQAGPRDHLPRLAYYALGPANSQKYNPSSLSAHTPVANADYYHGLTQGEVWQSA